MRNTRARARIFTIVGVLALAGVSTFAQGLNQDGRGGGRGGPPPTAKTIAPVDFTGYWSAVVVEDWRYRMLPPQKFAEKPTLGSRVKIPMNDEARKIALAWDPSKDEAAGEQCRGYGAPNVMRIPERIQVTWKDDQTLKLETDAGQQTRLFEFGAAKTPDGGWQGVSAASWETLPGGRGGPLFSGSLKIVTTKLKPGYLQRNGIPYSANATLTEYFDRVDEPGASYIVITTTVEDPTYLTEPYMTSTHFKKEADASGWNPSPCSAR
jgi:hypothetical protein